MYSNEEEQNIPSYYIPKNYETKTVTFLGRPVRNVVEGAVMASAVIPAFAFLPIDWLYRAILMAIFAAGLFSFGAFGIKQCCVSEYIFKVVQFKQSPQKVVLEEKNIFSDLLKKKETLDNSFEENVENIEQEPENDTTASEKKNTKRKRKKKNK